MAFPPLEPYSPESSFGSLILSARARTALTDLYRNFGDARSSLLRIRSDRMRLARTGWKPSPPAETKMIRATEWTVEKKVEKKVVNGASEATSGALDLEYAFVPSERAFLELSSNLAEIRSARIRSLDREESRYLIGGRPVPAPFFDLVFLLERNPGLLVSLPRIESYLEARFWAEILKSLETALELPRHSIRIEAGLETSIGLSEVDEVIFELKDSIESVFYDPRIDLADELHLESWFPAVPKYDIWKNPWAAPEVISRYENLVAIGDRRGIRVNAQPQPIIKDPLPLVTLKSLRQKTFFAFYFLCGWFQGKATWENRNWADFELARALIWTAIQSGFLREDHYDAWKEEFGSQPFELGTPEDSALRTLDLLLRTAVFPESAMSVAMRILLELEKTRSVRGGSSPQV